MRISDWSSDVCSSDLGIIRTVNRFHRASGGFFGVLGILARAYAFSAPTRLLTSQFMTVQSVLRPPPPAAPTPVPVPARHPAPAAHPGRAVPAKRPSRYPHQRSIPAHTARSEEHTSE